MPIAPTNLHDFSALVEIVRLLRSPEGCPWDKEQTHRSLAAFAIEEAHELAEAIEKGDLPEMVSELGDLLLQVVLHAQVGEDEKKFKMSDVIYAISEKMVRRHPHVFSDTKVKDSAEVLKNWGELKQGEKKKNTQAFNVPIHLPALQRAHNLGRKSGDYNFDWADIAGVWEKVQEELSELQQTMGKKDPKEVEHELGDLLFSLSQLGRHLGVDSEQALRTANRRFEERFEKMLSIGKIDAAKFKSLSAAEKEALWESAKTALRE